MPRVRWQPLVTRSGRIPWRELDVVSVPMGIGIGGVAWPGAVWIESTS